MRKVLAWVLLLTLCLGLFAGCKTTQEPEAAETTEPTVEVDPNGAANALAYVKTMYKNAGEKTPKDFTRIGVVPVGETKYEVVWTVDVSEDLVKIVVLENGMVTIDVNEATEVDVPYVLTATVTGSNGQTYSFSWNHLIPAAMSVEDILNEAYALEDGEALPYEVTLTGKIKSIDTAYSEDYQNITVTIVMEGHEDQPIQCYRLKGEGAKDLSVGNIITVTGTIKNYKGTIEFDAGCTLDNVEEGDAVEAPTDPYEIIDAAYELARGDSLPYPVTLTGIITSIDTAYSEEYKNITVTMAVPGRLNKPIMCYRMKGADAETLKALKTSDVITVSGTIVNYQGTREFNAGCQLISVEPGSGHTQPSDPVQVVEEAYALPLAGNLLYEAELTGTITKINTKYSSTYGNITVTMVVAGAEDKPIECYRMTGDDSKLAKLKVGDSITVKGLIKNYYSFSTNTSKIQYDKPVMLDCVFNEEPKEPETTAMKPVTEIKTGTAYKFGLQQNNLSGKPWQMITGDMDGYYFETVTDASMAKDVYLEQVTGGYQIYFLNGSTKTYLNIIPRDTDATKTNVVFQTAAQGTPSVYTLNTEYKYVYTTVNGTDWYLGTYNSYVTVSASKTSLISDTSKIGVSQFCAYFLEVDPDGGTTTPDTPSAGTATLLTEAPADGDVIIIYNSSKAMGAASGSKMSGVDATVTGTSLAVTSDMLQLTVVVDGSNYMFMSDGKYLTSGDTGNSMSLSDTLTDCGKWTLEAAESGKWYIKNVGANYNGNYNQAMEYYYGFTTYGIKTTDIYKMQLFKVEAGSSAASEAALMTEAPVNGDIVIVYNSNKAMGAASGSKMSGVDATVTGTTLAVTEDMLQLTVVVDGSNYMFMSDGKYLTSGDTGNSMSLSDTLTDCGKWTLESAESGKWYIKNVGANYNGNYNQAMEYYYGFTTYGIKTTDIYKMQLFKVNAGGSGSTGGNTGSGTMTAEQIVNAAYALAEGESMEDTQTLTGVIYSVDTAYSESWGNVTVTMVVGTMTDKPIVCYRLKGDGADVIKAGYTITVTGTLKNFYGTIEFDSGCTLDSYVAGTVTETTEADATITFDDTAKRTSISDDQQVWQENGITLTNDKAESTSNINPTYFNPVRLYSKTSATVSYTKGMTKIEFVCDSTTYANNLVSSIGTMAGVTVSVNVKTVTVTFDSAVTSFTIACINPQVRLNEIKVYC